MSVHSKYNRSFSLHYNQIVLFSFKLFINRILSAHLFKKRNLERELTLLPIFCKSLAVGSPPIPLKRKLPGAERTAETIERRQNAWSLMACCAEDDRSNCFRYIYIYAHTHTQRERPGREPRGGRGERESWGALTSHFFLSISCRSTRAVEPPTPNAVSYVIDFGIFN